MTVFLENGSEGRSPRQSGGRGEGGGAGVEVSLAAGEEDGRELLEL